ncbi:COP1-interacting protein 7 [Euphorbia lathyris]|uniref:COP1-interacting protein 7 n=1 Tax=Euphorbia lathyris TaxID=212925 RepID=UPI0033138A3C
MKSSTRLHSAVFQLTPTRTRCDLVITANGRTEKIASGLVTPFLAHLRIAQDQMDKGGYSIILEPEPGNDATWFTRGTVERFVRFVSTPEILERVYTLESEILQIEEAIAIQSNNDVGLEMVEDHQVKPLERNEGSKPLLDTNEKAIVLYKPAASPPEANGSTAQEENSKVQLMKVLETRKSVLQKEQGMAFARAVAAGFDIDHMAPLMSFAESFGATRLSDACKRFKDLWKRKHETGQWVEIEAAEAMSSRLEFSAMNPSGIVLSNSVNKQWPGTPESNGKAGAESNADEKPPMDQQPSVSNQEYFQGQFPHPMFPPWPIQSPPGTMPVFPGYPMQCVPYYQNYPGNGPFFQSPYPSDAGQRKGLRRQSMDSGDGNIDPETGEMDAELENETLENQESGKKSSRSNKKKSGMVVIRNLNYITSKRQESSDSESQLASGSETDGEDRDFSAPTSSIKHKNSQRSSKKKGIHTDKLESYNEGGTNGNEVDGKNWEAFQDYLLKGADDVEHATNNDMITMEKEVQVKRRQHRASHDPLLLDQRGAYDNEEGNMTDILSISGNLAHMKRLSNDESLLSQQMRQSSDGILMDGQMDMQSEVDGRRARYRSRNDDFMIHRQENQSGYASSDPLAVNGFVHPRKDLGKNASHNVDDDSYVVALRSTSIDQIGADGRPIIDMDSEFPSSQPENSSKRVGSQVKYEPDDFSLMPERDLGKGLVGYDPALDYDMQVQAENGVPLDKKNKEAVTGARQGSKKVDKNSKSRLVPETSDKKKTVGPIRKGKPSKLSPLEEAKARAEKLRNYKADLQKMKKEKEEQEMKRLEALKLERQKRIASRGGSIPAQPTSQQTRKQLPAKLSPNPHKTSKFSDSETGSVSPLQRFPTRTISVGSSESLKSSKAGKVSTSSHSAGNRLSRSVASLPEPKKENSNITHDAKASMARIRRLSEPKMSSSNHVTSVKPRNTEPVSKPKVSSAPESKKLSAIVNYDKNKIASLPELKIRTMKRPDGSNGKSVAKVLPQSVNESRSNTTSEGTELKRNGDKNSHHSDGDDNPIIEKKVLIQECDKSLIPALWTEDNTGVMGHSSNYAAIRAPVSQPNTEVLPGAPKGATASNAEKELPKLSSIVPSEKPYQAPFARVSSLEDSSTRNSEYGKAPPTSLQTTTGGMETIKARVSDANSFKLEKISEVLDKPQTKESSKGFRRLLKFGKKNHSSGERNAESDNVSVTGSEAGDSVANIASSSEVNTLKNLISQDDTSSASTTPQKTSRHFSLLSPFRSKTSEKKLNT